MMIFRFRSYIACAAFAAAMPVCAQISQPDSLSRNIPEVVVTGARASTDLRHLPVTVNILDREALTREHHSSILPTVTSNVPGLFNTARGVMGYGISGGGSGGISVRGLGSGEGRMMVLIDGHPQYSGIYGHAIADAYQTMMAEKVEVLRGPASMIYGSNAMGGVINIVTRRPRQNGVNTSLNLGAGSWGTFISEVSNSVRHNGFASNIAAQYNRSDNHRPDMGFEQYGGHANIAYEFNPHWRVFADGDVTHFNASQPGSVSAPMAEADQWITRGVVNAGVDNNFGPELKNLAGSLTVYSNFGRHKINDGYEVGVGEPQNRLFRSKDILTGVALHQSAAFFPGSRITLGLDYQHIYGHAYYTSRSTGEVIDTPNKQSGKERQNEVAAYVNIHQDFCSWLTADAGIRYDWHSVVGGEWVPQGGLVFRPTPSAELKAMVGKGFRYPTMREMYLYPPSNEELKPESIVNYELAWSQRLVDGRVHYAVNIFYLNGDNLIQTVNRKNINTGKVENWGIEAEASWRINPHWIVATNHTWLHMVHPLVAAPQYKGVASVEYSWRGLSLILDFQQIAGLYSTVGSANHQENFSLLGLSANYRICRYVALWARGDNLLAQKYEINAGYPMPRATFLAGIKLDF